MEHLSWCNPQNTLYNESGDLRSVCLKKGVYCIEKREKGKKVFAPLETQPESGSAIELFRYYTCLKQDKKYKKHVSWLGMGAGESVAVLEYFGNFPGLSGHGNAKTKGATVRMSAKVMSEMSELLKTNKPQHVYNKLAGKYDDLSGPSGKKQVYDKRHNDKRMQMKSDIGHVTRRKNIADHVNELDKLLTDETSIVKSIIRDQGKPLYRFDVDSNTRDIFIQKLREKGSSQLLPHFSEGNTCFYCLKRNGLYIVATTKSEVSPILLIEILTRIYHVIKDFCGTVSEETVMANSLLIMEILDEIIDFGLMQLSETEKLRPYIQSNPVIVKSDREPTSELTSRVFGIETKTASSSASDKPVIGPVTDMDGKKNELFVDVIERLSAVFDPDGSLSRAEVHGTIKMKNFLMGCPQIKIALNEDLTVNATGAVKAYGDQVQLDSSNFHQCVRSDDFEQTRVFSVYPSVGEFSVMTYSIGGDVTFRLPLRLRPFLADVDGSRDKMLTLRLKCDTPSNFAAVGIHVKVPVPQAVTGISQQLSGDGQTAELRQSDRKLCWKIRKLASQTEVIAQFRLISQTGSKVNRHELGPASIDFEVTGYACSGLQIKNVKIVQKDSSQAPKRWLRHITVSDSYIVKI